LQIRTESHRAGLCGEANDALELKALGTLRFVHAKRVPTRTGAVQIESRAQMSMLPRNLAIVPTAQFRRLRL
jgi:hypothetical protein